MVSFGDKVLNFKNNKYIKIFKIKKYCFDHFIFELFLWQKLENG